MSKTRPRAAALALAAATLSAGRAEATSTWSIGDVFRGLVNGPRALYRIGSKSGPSW
jgi:hypothetical protein